MIAVAFQIPEATILLNAWQRMHFRNQKRHMEELAWKVLTVARDLRPSRPFEHCTIEVERGSSQLPDWDGLYGGLKPLLDVLCARGNVKNNGGVAHPYGLGFIADDNPRCVIRLNALPVLCKRGASFTRVRIVEASPT